MIIWRAIIKNTKTNEKFKKEVQAHCQEDALKAIGIKEPLMLLAIYQAPEETMIPEEVMRRYEIRQKQFEKLKNRQ